MVGDVRLNYLNKPIEPSVYTPLAQNPAGPACLVARVSGDPLGLVTAVQQAVWAEAKDQPVEHISTMERIVEAASAETRFYSTPRLSLRMPPMSIPINRSIGR